MPIFSYSAVDSEGTSQKGMIHGETIGAVMDSLAQKGWTIQQLGLAEVVADPITEPDRAKPSGYGPPPPTERRSRLATDLVGPLVGGVPLTDLHFFFRQLATMLHAGIGAADTLSSLAEQSKNATLRRILTETRDHVAHGRPMSTGFQRYPEVFSPVMMGIVRAGEEGGCLSDHCKILAEYIQRDIELRNMVRRETFYPKLVFFASILIITSTNVIINALKPGARGIDAPTMIWVIVCIAVVCLYFFRKVLLQQPAVRRPWDEILCGIPWYGEMVKGFAMSRFGRAFGAMHESGLSLSRAVTLAADSCGNEAIRAKIYPLGHQMDSGEGIHSSFARSGAFTPVVLDMIRAGEMTGNMNEMLVKVAEYYEDEGQTRARQSAMLLGGAMILLVGAYVGYIVITFWLGYAMDRTQGI